MAKAKKRNHYLPRFYLKGFCDSNNRVWMYKKTNPMQPAAGSPGDMALVKKLYHLEGSADAKDEIENYFEKSIETPVSPAFKRLLGKEFPDEKGKGRLSLFFAMLMVRTPIYIDHLKKQQSKEFVAKAKAGASNKEHFYFVYRKIHTGLDDATIENDRLLILNNEIEFETNKDITLVIMLNLGESIAPLLQKMKWVLIETTNDLPLILSDNFMNVSNPSSQTGFYSSGLAMPDACVYFPISKTLALLMVNNNNFNENVVYDINNPPILNAGKVNLKELIKSYNKKIYCEASRYVFASEDSEKLKHCFKSLLDKAREIEEQLKNQNIKDKE